MHLRVTVIRAVRKETLSSQWINTMEIGARRCEAAQLWISNPSGYKIKFRTCTPKQHQISHLRSNKPSISYSQLQHHISQVNHALTRVSPQKNQIKPPLWLDPFSTPKHTASGFQFPFHSFIQRMYNAACLLSISSRSTRYLLSKRHLCNHSSA